MGRFGQRRDLAGLEELTGGRETGVEAETAAGRETTSRNIFYLFMAVLGLCYCAQAFSSCNEWGRPSS